MNAVQAHATALRVAKKRGFRVTFTHQASATQDANGQLTPGASSSIDCWCVQDNTEGDPSAFQALKLIEASAVRLYATPVTINTTARIADKSTFESRTVKTVDAYRFGGNKEIIGAWVVLV